jgi:hypothetical protein
MAKVSIQVDNLTVTGEVADGEAFLMQVLRLINRKPSSKPSAFRQVYALAPARTDREFVALVAVYRHRYRGFATSSRDVQRLARLTRRRLSNVSTAIAEAENVDDLKKIGKGRPAKYRPTETAIKRWDPFIPERPGDGS